MTVFWKAVIVAVQIAGGLLIAVVVSVPMPLLLIGVLPLTVVLLRPLLRALVERIRFPGKNGRYGDHGWVPDGVPLRFRVDYLKWRVDQFRTPVEVSEALVKVSDAVVESERLFTTGWGSRMWAYCSYVGYPSEPERQQELRRRSDLAAHLSSTQRAHQFALDALRSASPGEMEQLVRHEMDTRSKTEGVEQAWREQDHRCRLMQSRVAVHEQSHQALLDVQSRLQAQLHAANGAPPAAQATAGV